MENEEGEDVEGSGEAEQREEGTALITSTKLPGIPPPSIFDALFAESGKTQNTMETIEKNEAPREIGQTAPAPSNTPAVGDSGGSSMDLFKSIFASDEEIEDVDDAENEDMPPPPSSPEVLSSMTSLAHDKDNTDGNTAYKDDAVREAPISPPHPEPALPDLSVHKLFKHLFNPELDSGRWWSLYFKL
ncbi:unnamed protein product [Hydatigera taeniaeformis]|uniref:BSD domain-containing protein n=1 Tax=Hydatigena taeniaeformis TaxID=6205 RepID=A0A0R3WWK4_HYDTA|nr:unnamed protein product [Hydatigera taeniaeformis]